MQVSIEHMSPIQFPILIYIYIKTENHINLFLNMLSLNPYMSKLMNYVIVTPSFLINWQKYDTPDSVESYVS